ncbi:hypothetical protein BT69DRAFT_205550 [Atractiella rhizophila]|nr:hypothetical protein BT69DRAFT_205550 [Atractiella rhizophila]
MGNRTGPKPPTQCSYCPMTFKKLEHAQRHERTHTLDRPFACSVCGKAFARQDTLNRHARLHNRTEEELAQKSRRRRKTNPDAKSPTDANNAKAPPATTIASTASIFISHEPPRRRFSDVGYGSTRPTFLDALPSPGQGFTNAGSYSAKSSTIPLPRLDHFEGGSDPSFPFHRRPSMDVYDPTFVASLPTYAHSFPSPVSTCSLDLLNLSLHSPHLLPAPPSMLQPHPHHVDMGLDAMFMPHPFPPQPQQTPATQFASLHLDAQHWANKAELPPLDLDILQAPSPSNQSDSSSSSHPSSGLSHKSSLTEFTQYSPHPAAHHQLPKSDPTQELLKLLGSSSAHSQPTQLQWEQAQQSLMFPVGQNMPPASNGGSFEAFPSLSIISRANGLGLEGMGPIEQPKVQVAERDKSPPGANANSPTEKWQNKLETVVEEVHQETQDEKPVKFFTKVVMGEEKEPTEIQHIEHATEEGIATPSS